MFNQISEEFWLRAKEYVAEQGLNNPLKRNAQPQRESNELNMIQHCFLYCLLYPEDYPISPEHLIRKFISEGLVDGRSRREKSEQGHSILDKLVNLCLLESCVNYKNEECVKMHDLVRSMALEICKEKYMVRAGELSLKELPGEEEWTKDLEVSLLDYDTQRIGEGISPECPMLSTLLLWGNQWLEVITDSFFSKMKGLCTLDLSGISEITMPDSTSDLASACRRLVAYWYKLRSVPYLGKMNALRKLDLSGTAIDEVPQVLEKLFNPNMKLFTKGLLQKLMVRAGNLHIGEPMLDSRGSQGERLLTNGMVGDAFIENPEMVLNRMEDRQVSQMPMAPPPSQSPPSLHTPMAPSPSQQMLMAPSPSQTPPSPPPLMQFLQYVVPTMLVFLTMRYGAKPEALFGKHRIPLRCFIATTSIYWLTAGVMKQMVLTTEARKMCYLVLSQIALASGIQSLLFLLSMFLNHVPPTMISLLISAPIALLIVHLLINMVFGAGGRNSTDQPVRLPV